MNDFRMPVIEGNTNDLLERWAVCHDCYIFCMIPCIKSDSIRLLLLMTAMRLGALEHHRHKYIKLNRAAIALSI